MLQKRCGYIGNLRMPLQISPSPLPVGMPCSGNFHGWSASPVNFLLGIWCMQEGKSPVITVSVAVVVLLYLGYGFFLEKIAGKLFERLPRENRKAVFTIGGHLLYEYSLKRPVNFVA